MLAYSISPVDKKWLLLRERRNILVKETPARCLGNKTLVGFRSMKRKNENERKMHRMINWIVSVEQWIISRCRFIQRQTMLNCEILKYNDILGQQKRLMIFWTYHEINLCASLESFLLKLSILNFQGNDECNCLSNSCLLKQWLGEIAQYFMWNTEIVLGKIWRWSQKLNQFTWRIGKFKCMSDNGMAL